MESKMESGLGVLCISRCAGAAGQASTTSLAGRAGWGGRQTPSVRASGSAFGTATSPRGGVGRAVLVEGAAVSGRRHGEKITPRRAFRGTPDAEAGRVLRVRLREKASWRMGCAFVASGGRLWRAVLEVRAEKAGVDGPKERPCSARMPS